VPPRSRGTRRPGQYADDGPGAAAPGAPAQKTSLHASERETPPVQQARALDQQRLTALALPRWTCVDASGVNLALTRGSGRAPAGARGMGSGPPPDGQNVTRRGALGPHGLHAVMSVDGATDTEVLRTELKQVLGPPLRPGESVMIDHLWAPQAVGVQQALARRGARLLDWPPSAPDLSPLEPCWSKVQTVLRPAKARTREAPGLGAPSVAPLLGQTRGPPNPNPGASPGGGGAARRLCLTIVRK
jgi:hypothetical protein